jgi:D-proline reductase (dithiol) PrdB
VGLVARVIEQAGIPTVLVSTGRDLTAQVRPPRSLFVNFPMGNPFGRSGDVAMQRRVLVAALELAVTAQHEGVLVDFPCDWGAPFASLVDAVTDAM